MSVAPLESDVRSALVNDLLDATLLRALEALPPGHAAQARHRVRRALERVLDDAVNYASILLDLERTRARGDRHVVGCIRCRSGAVSLPLRGLKRAVERLRVQRKTWERRLGGYS